MGKKGGKKEVTGRDTRKADKMVEDKTFGMKSKKSKKVQNIISQTKAAVLGTSERAMQEAKLNQKKEKKKKQEEQMLLGYLKKTVMADKKEKKKDEQLTQEEEKENEKTASINLYVDPREPDPNRSPKPCDDFIEACEKNVYGWNWKCPSGVKCLYAHALPEGYMLKSTMEALMKMQQEEDANKALEFQIEEERAKLNVDKCTRVTKDTFEAWHKKRKAKIMKRKKEETKTMAKAVKGSNVTGRALMKLGVEDGEADGQEENYERKQDDEEDENIIEHKFGFDEEEEDEKAPTDAPEAAENIENVDEDLFNEEDLDDVDLDDLE